LFPVLYALQSELLPLGFLTDNFERFHCLSYVDKSPSEGQSLRG
jgi:hypothetical protein